LPEASVHPWGAAHQEGKALRAQPLDQAPADLLRHRAVPASGQQHPRLLDRETKSLARLRLAHLKSHHTLTSMNGFHEGATQFSLLPSSFFQIFFPLFDRVFFYCYLWALVGFFDQLLQLLSEREVLQ
jgi:hypothetical protein